MAKLIDFKKQGKKFEIKNKSQTKAEIIIYDQIGSSFWEDGVSAKGFTEELNKLPESIKLIDVRINSPGGSVFEGYTIFNRLKQHKAEIHVYIDGLAASIASLIALAGTKVIMAETSQIMIHKPLVGVWGNSKDLEVMIERLDSIENQLIKVYRNKTGMDYFDIATMLENETWFSAEEALSYGFVDEVVDLGEDAKFAATSCMGDLLKNASWIKNKPEVKVNEDIRNKINKLIKDNEGFSAR